MAKNYNEFSNLIEPFFDDLNTSKMQMQMDVLLMEYYGSYDRIREQHAARKLIWLMNLYGLASPTWFVAENEEFIGRRIALRLEARRTKNFAESDRIRDELAAMGIALKDGKDADGNPVTTWEVKR